jgi:hypothetical protein
MVGLCIQEGIAKFKVVHLTGVCQPSAKVPLRGVPVCAKGVKAGCCCVEFGQKKKKEEEVYICSSRLGLIKMDHHPSGNGRNSQQ